MYIKEDIAKPFYYSGGETGIVLIHGFTACPIDMRPLGDILREWGYSVRAPLLPGHGTTPEEMKGTSWEDWLEEADRSVQSLRESCTRVMAVGHSMGGLIALALAAEQKVDGVVSINAPIVYREPDLHEAYYLLGKQEYVNKPNKNSEMNVNREGLPHFSYMKVPVQCFVSLNQAISAVRGQLAQIECPTQVIQSLEDQTIHPSSGEIIVNSIQHTNKEVIFWEKEDHYLPLSSARGDLAEKIKSFTQRYQLG